MKTMLKYLSIGTCFLLPFVAQAQITYVDATDTASGNTSLASGGVFTGIAQSSTPNDGEWDLRAFANSATIFQNAGTTAGVDTNAVRLVTSVSGLPSDTYEVLVYFWTDSSPTWRIGASMTDELGQLPLYQASTPGVVQFYAGYDNLGTPVFSSTLGPNPFASDVMIAEGNRRLLQASLGQVTGTGFSVFIEGDQSMTGQDQRTWYDGIGYSVVPEPTSAALLGLGALAVLCFRRRA